MRRCDSEGSNIWSLEQQIGDVEGLPDLGIVAGLLEGGTADSDRLRADADPAAVERGHGDLEAVALLPEALRDRDFHVLEEDGAGRRGADAELFVGLLPHEPR